MISSLQFAKDKSLFEVNNIFCVGKNYLDHVKEFANYEIPKEPVIFLKPTSALCYSGSSVRIPQIEGEDISTDLQNEVELVIAVKSEFSNDNYSSSDIISGIGLGFDLTLRDIQSIAKSKGLPWSVSKGFKDSAPVSEFFNLSDYQNEIEFSLNVNGEQRQKGNSKDMMFDFESILKYINSIFGLQKGDIIFTGTPAGISTLQKGDLLEGYIFDDNVLEINIT